MVDFRYHLVSLIAVFMALAVGVVLGAGPLQNSIGSALNDQVESLRVSRDEAREDADEADQRSEAYQQGLVSLAPDMIEGTLDGQSVVIVTLPNTSEEAIEIHRTNLAAAGADVTGTLQLTETFFSPGSSSYRTALAGQLDSYVDQGDSPLGTLGRGLELIVTTDIDDGSAATLAQLYQASDNALIEVKDTLTGPATAILLIGPTDEEIPDEIDDEYETIRANQIELISSIDTPLVFTSGSGDGTLLDAVRADDRSASTVDSPEDATALINIPFALTQELTGSTVTWGVGGSADLVLGNAAPIELAADPATDGAEGDELEDAGEVDLRDPLNENPVEPTSEPEEGSDDTSAAEDDES